MGDITKSSVSAWKEPDGRQGSGHMRRLGITNMPFSQETGWHCGQSGTLDICVCARLKSLFAQLLFILETGKCVRRHFIGHYSAPPIAKLFKVLGLAAKPFQRRPAISKCLTQIPLCHFIYFHMSPNTNYSDSQIIHVQRVAGKLQIVINMETQLRLKAKLWVYIFHISPKFQQ